MTLYRVPHQVLERTFMHFRQCGRGRRECQVLWTSTWRAPATIDNVVHPQHAAHSGGFVVNDSWLTAFWLELGETKSGIRFQVHTHPRTAFHSPTDDAFPIIHKPGFLSLVIPDFALGPVGFAGAFLTEIQENGQWKQVAIQDRVVII